jgi:hypothetical protein
MGGGGEMKKCGKCRYFQSLYCPYPAAVTKKDTNACVSYKRIYLRSTPAKLNHKPLGGKEGE